MSPNAPFRNSAALLLNSAVLVLLLALMPPIQAQQSAPPLLIDARTSAGAPEPLDFEAGGRSPEGHTLAVNSRYLLLDGKPWLPVMGEMHYARVPASEWETELLKMKAGGVNIVSTYVFWIHHEEAEGQFDWSGQRDLRRFIQLCGKVGLYAWVRTGPWAHGETRNGGIPDWVLRQGPTREDDPVYLRSVARYIGEVQRQLAGLLWKDGGPVIGMQLENEYSARGAHRGEEHILTLRRIAREAGLDLPFYSVTGWDNAAVPAKGVVPFFGGYADGFWWRNPGEQPPSPNYFFTAIRCEENVGNDLLSKRPDIDAFCHRYPLVTAEMGGGMEQSYHRRLSLSPADTAALTVVKLGAGAALYGYYMFHGGTNPEGKLTTYQETQATGSVNDLPVMGYDYQAPLGEYGQMHPVFHDLRTLHLFLSDYGAQLAPMAPYFATPAPRTLNDTSTPRVAGRFEGSRGFLFLNNHQRNYELPEHRNFQVQVQLPASLVTVPRHPISVPSGAYAIWPVNLDLDGVRLRYATAQLLARLDDPATVVFFAWPGIEPEFVFEGIAAQAVEAAGARVIAEHGIVIVTAMKPGSGAAIRLHTPSGKTLQIVLLSRDQARQTWKATLAGRDHLLLSPADLWFEGDRVQLRSRSATALRAGVYPPLEHAPAAMPASGRDGLFTVYGASVPAQNIVVKTEKTKSGAASIPVKIGGDVALPPPEEAWEHAARWRISIPPVTAPQVSAVFLRFQYAGDTARLFSGPRLVTDDFYHGAPWEIGLWRTGGLSKPQQLELRLLPLRQDAPIHLPAGAWPAFPASGEVADLQSVTAIPEYQAVLDAGR